MKVFLQTLSIICLGLTLNAQSDKVKTKTQTSGETPSDVKTKYISNQDYLSPSTLKDYQSFYGDSLNGFDDTPFKARAMGASVYGQEYLGYMNRVKRDFINKKYNIGVKPVYVTPTPPSLSKPGKNIGGGSMVNVAPCVNEDFEATPVGLYAGAANSLAINGWTITGTQPVNCGTVGWAAGSTKIWVQNTPLTGIPGINNLGNSPLGGSRIVQMNDWTPVNGSYQIKTKLSQTIPVTAANTLFQFAYAGVYYDGTHQCCDQPGVQIQMYTCSVTPQPLACSNLSLNAIGAQCTSGSGGYTLTNVPGIGNCSWTNWTVKYIDLTPYIGNCVTLEVINTDCNFGGHFGVTYFDAQCGGQLVGTGIGGTGGSIAGPVSFCAGSNQALIHAPLGYSTYQWYGPGTGTSNPGPAIAAPGGTAAVLSISNPVPGAVFTVDLTTPSGCGFVSTNTLTFSQVNIAGIGSTTTCIGGASGSSTVVGNGSGTGYNYTWMNSSGTTIGTNSVVNGLAPGVYSVVISGLGAAGCGTAMASTTVTAAPPVPTMLLKPYCGSQAYLGVTGGSNFKWYNNAGQLITGAGSGAQTFTLNNPVTNNKVYLSHMSQFGCQDSTIWTLVGSNPGTLQIPLSGIKLICPGASNGTANIVMAPAVGAPPGTNAFSVTSTGAISPPYNSFVSPTAANTFTVGGLQAGTYSVSAFDGSCKYNATFNVNALVFNYTLTSTTPTLCPGQNTPASINFGSTPTLGQYSYSWSPTTWLVGNNGTLQNTLITPTVPVGNVIPMIYTVVVTPSAAPCPITKQLTVTAVNPAIPTITAIPDLCNTSAPYVIQVSPAGGTFINSAATPNLISALGGQITPSAGVVGVNTNTFVYSTSVGGCVATKTGFFTVSKFNPATLTSTAPAMCVNGAQFNLMNVVLSATSGSWTGSGVIGSSGNYSFNPSGFNTTPFTNVPVIYNTSSLPVNTCPDSATLTIPVTNTVTPVIAPANIICTKNQPFTMGVNPPGGSWSGNGISAAGVITPSLYTNAGMYNLTYSVAVGPCLNVGNTSVNVAKFNSSTISGTVSPLCVTANTVYLPAIVQNTLGSWACQNCGGANALPNPVSGPAFNAAVTPTGTITYVLSYYNNSTPPLPMGQCDATSTIAVSVYHPEIPVITQMGPFCSKNPSFQLQAVPNTGHWTSSSYVSPGGIFTPSLSAVGNNAIQYVVGTSTCNAQNTEYINVEAFVPATIIQNTLPDQCKTGPAINLTPFTLTNLGAWSGAGIAGSSFNPAMAGKGSFVLTHNTASSPSGLCPDQATVSVNVYSLGIPAVATIQPMCDNAMPQKIQANPPGGLFGGANNTAVADDGMFSPGSAVLGNNLINYSITSGPCVAYTQATVVVEKFVSAELAMAVKDFCGNESPMNLMTYVKHPTGHWTGQGITGTSMFDPSQANFTGVTTVVYHTFSSPSGIYCPDSREVNITVKTSATIEALATITEGCAPLEVPFMNVSSQVGGNSVWTLGDGSEPQQGHSLSHVYTSPGTYHAVLSYSNDIGCATRKEVQKAIVVYPMPVANFSAPEEVLISSPEVQLTNQSTVLGDNKYKWQVEGVPEFNQYTNVHPAIEFTKIGKYQVTLTAETNKGCTNSITKTIEVKNDFNIFIPTSFTPNYDGLNDEFKPVFTEFGLDMKSFEMEIFDRWGHSLYRTRDVNKGWDGSLQNKGEPLKEEVYVYRIKYKDMDGNSYTKMGHLSLVK